MSKQAGPVQGTCRRSAGASSATSLLAAPHQAEPIQIPLARLRVNIKTFAATGVVERDRNSDMAPRLLARRSRRTRRANKISRF